VYTIPILSVHDTNLKCKACFERAVAFAHYARHATELTSAELCAGAGIPLGGVKGRMNQTVSAMGRVQLKHYAARAAEIQRGMHRFWDLIETFETPGLVPIRADRSSGSTMGGWYSPRGWYEPSQLGGLPVERFIEALAAEGVISGNFDPHSEGICCAPISAGPGNKALHSHPVFNSVDIFGDGKPTAAACADSAAVARPALPAVESLGARTYAVPWFKHDRPEAIARFAAAFIKVARAHARLLDSEPPATEPVAPAAAESYICS